MTFFKLLSFLSVVVAASAGPMVLHERRTAVPSGFVRHGAAPANQTITLRVALTASNVGGLEEKLTSLATPGSPDFRQWLSKDDVKAFASPSPETVSAFGAFASANGLTPKVISPNGDWVSITLPVSKANKLFAAEFDVFTHPSLAGPIRAHALCPSSRLMFRWFRDVELRRLGPAPSSLWNPRYSRTETSNILAATGYESEFASIADLAQFLTLLRPDISNTTTFTLVTADNGTNPQGPFDAGFEANLDIQYTAGIATGVPVQFYSVGGSVTTFPDSLFDTSTFLEGFDNPPSVLSTSYGRIESAFGASVATKICNGYMGPRCARNICDICLGRRRCARKPRRQLLVREQHIFACLPRKLSVRYFSRFNPRFRSGEGHHFTGGWIFERIPFAVLPDRGQWLDSWRQFPRTSQGSSTAPGRGYPDVATQGWNFEIVVDGQVFLEGGTSASAPTFASIIALINDRLVAAGKPVLGFLNPFLYSTASSTFTDITSGHNSGNVCPASSVAFDAAVGWDPLTGFGTPVFPRPPGRRIGIVVPVRNSISRSALGGPPRSVAFLERTVRESKDNGKKYR
ncbi:subtilisin-like protein [Mycena olivaceomarginata]|nr:subtilisin-like protein [Mycena olivaceomarginata]